MSKTEEVRLWRQDAITNLLPNFEDSDELQSSVDMMAAALIGMSISGVEYESVIEIVSKQWNSAENLLGELMKLSGGQRMSDYDAELHHFVQYDTYYTGIIYNDKKHRFMDGTSIITSHIKDVTDDILTTRNTKYKLVESDKGENT